MLFCSKLEQYHQIGQCRSDYLYKSIQIKCTK